MRLQFIGTGSGKTSLKRNHSSILISSSNHNLLIDAGDGISKSLLLQNINYNSIDSILFTHYHADHFSGITSLITQMKLTKRKNSLKIYTHGKLISTLKSFLNNCYLFEEKFGFDFKIIGFSENEITIINEEINFTARENSHIKKSDLLKNYDLINFVSCSFYFEINSGTETGHNKKIIYTSDIGNADDLFLFKDKTADYFITETSHISLEEIYKFYKLQNQKRLFLTHIEDEKEAEILNFVSNLDDDDKKRISAVFDNFVLTL